MERPARVLSATSPLLRLGALAACVAGVAVLPSVTVGQTYTTILDSSESQTPQGVRGTDGSQVLIAASYTLSGSLPQGMWWKGSLTTGSGVAYKVLPDIGGQTVTSSLYYGPNTPEFDATLGAGNIRIVGSYQYVGSTQFNNGLLYTGPLSGTGGVWQQINVPNSAVSGTVANTIPHSVMGSIVVGNYNLVVDGTAGRLGNAFLYNIATDTWTIFDAPFGGTDQATSAYGIWQNDGTSFTIAGGSTDDGLNKAFLINYNSLSGSFSDLTYFHDGAPAGMTHFEGITGTPTGYNVVGIAGTGYAFASIPRNLDGSFGPAEWRGPLSFPDSSMTTGNTVIGDQALGIYTLASSTGVIYAYVATVPEPTAALPALLGVGAAFALAIRRRSVSESRPSVLP